MSARLPIFISVFGKESWDAMPGVMHKHYANRPFSNDVVVVEGIMDIRTSIWMRLLTPMLKLVGTLVPYEGVGVPVTVDFRSESASNAYCFDRVFHFPGRRPYRFRSRMLPVGGGEVIEYMRFGLGWKAQYRYEQGKVILSHRGYVWGRIPLPIGLLLGKGYAEEEAIDANTFRMMMHIQHPWFGLIYSYSGTFAVKEVRLDG